jgi:hypothetical protein
LFFFPIFGRKLSLKNQKYRPKFKFSATFWQTLGQKVKRRENGASHAIFRPKIPMCTKNEKNWKNTVRTLTICYHLYLTYHKLA